MEVLFRSGRVAVYRTVERSDCRSRGNLNQRTHAPMVFMTDTNNGVPTTARSLSGLGCGRLGARVIGLSGTSMAWQALQPNTSQNAAIAVQDHRETGSGI
jgi:hypothetical protein